MRQIASGLLVLMILFSLLPPTAHAQPPDPELANELVAALNTWRLEQDLWPLQRNATLDALAQQQADYLIGLPAIPDDIHTGEDGSSPPSRASAPPYNWPVYGRSDRVAIVEIGYVGANANAAINWWRGSSIHTRSVTNAGYREIGVGTAPHRFGNLMIIVLGSRPNVLPAQADTENGVLYLSDEQYRWAGSGPDWVTSATQIQLFDASGQPLSQGWQPWEAVMTLPDDAGDQLYVLYSDGTQQALAPVSLTSNLVVLPDTLAVIMALEETVEQQATAVPTLSPTTAPNAAPTDAAPTARPTQVAESDSAPAATAPPTIVPAAPTASSTPAASPTPTAVPGSEPDVALIYDAQSLTVLNVSGKAKDLSSLAFSAADSQITISRWQNQYLNVSLSSFPADDCLQVWAWTETTDPVKPRDCRILRSALTISPSRVFWTEGEFDVFWDSTRLTTCSADESECIVELPAFVQ